MKYILYFLLAFGLTHSIQTAGSDVATPINKVYKNAIVVDSVALSQVNEQIPFNITVTPPDEDPTPENIVKYLLDLLGGILATIILAWLHKKFPNIFPSKKPGDYIQRK
jgi:hypothetical protein